MIGSSLELALPVLRLLRGAGFTIDCICTRKALRGHPAIERFVWARDAASVVQHAALAIRQRAYQLVVLTDDKTIRQIVLSAACELSEPEKLRLLPVASPRDFHHLSSKIGLSATLAAHGVTTPEFEPVRNADELASAVRQMGFPLILKGDFSSGGSQTFKLLNEQQFRELPQPFGFFPAVLQRHIQGPLIAIEAFYQDARLVQFGYAKALRLQHDNEFSPSCLREFSPRAHLDARLVDELTRLGAALGAHGFANISCIECPADGKRYYFEADLRPTVWCDYPRHFGDDPALRIRGHFLAGETRGTSCPAGEDLPERITLAYPLRLQWWEVLTNRYACWRVWPDDAWAARIVLRRSKHQLLAILNLKAARHWIRRRLKRSPRDRAAR
jgi:hypothetical protein